LASEYGVVRSLPFAFAQQLIALRGRQVVEVVHQRAAALVHLAALFVFHLKRLPRGDDDRGRGVQRGAGHALGLVQIHHRESARLRAARVVGMQAVAQGAQRLLADRLARHQPQDHAVLAAQQVRVDQRHAFGRQPGLAAAGGHAQAEVRHVGGKPDSGLYGLPRPHRRSVVAVKAIDGDGSSWQALK
jgi:hypothetical protein